MSGDRSAWMSWKSYRGKFGLGIERDLYFGEKQASQVIHAA